MIPAAVQKESEAYIIMKQIQAIYREGDKLKKLSSEERLKQRQAIVKPIVDAFLCTSNKKNQMFLGWCLKTYSLCTI